MNVEFITKTDLQEFKSELLGEIKFIISASERPRQQWLKSNEVRKILSCSHGTLQNLRINGTLSPNKLGGTWYYSKDQIYAYLTKITW